MPSKRNLLILFSVSFLAAVGLIDVSASSIRQSLDAAKAQDPRGWGTNHAGKPVPEFVHGDECLFCHRNDIGPGWSVNAHGQTMRQREDAPEYEEILKQPALVALAPEVKYFLGVRHRVRFLKKAGYGKFSLLNSQAEIAAGGHLGKLLDADKPVWNAERFANSCAGCHATGVEAATRAFTSFGLDCYTCHGVVDLNHTHDTSLIFLSKKRRSDARAITSTCAQCHLRAASRSRSTGLPYPNNFVAGDNLFQDYDVDFSKADAANLNPGDRHIFQNVRDVVINGSEYPTCISCHDIHKESSVKHHRAPRTAMCADCHNAEGPIKGSKPYAVRSGLCEY